MKNTSKYFDEFAWAVPMAFLDPLSKCRFEQGDILYENKKVYQLSWDKALKLMNYSIQVSEPSRAQTAKTSQDSEMVFISNWDSEVVFDLHNYKNGTQEKIKSTQGRLYTLLWKGDLNAILNLEIAPPKPIIVKDVMKKLNTIKTYIKSSIPTDGQCIFFFPFDLTNPILRNKPDKIRAKLDQQNESVSYTIFFKTATELDLPSAELYSPTLRIAIFSMSGELELINEILKKALYTPSKNKKTQKEMFRLKAHGELILL